MPGGKEFSMSEVRALPCRKRDTQGLLRWLRVSYKAADNNDVAIVSGVYKDKGALAKIYHV